MEEGIIRDGRNRIESCNVCQSHDVQNKDQIAKQSILGSHEAMMLSLPWKFITIEGNIEIIT